MSNRSNFPEIIFVDPDIKEFSDGIKQNIDNIRKSHHTCTVMINAVDAAIVKPLKDADTIDKFIKQYNDKNNLIFVDCIDMIVADMKGLECQKDAFFKILSRNTDTEFVHSTLENIKRYLNDRIIPCWDMINNIKERRTASTKLFAN